MESNVDQLNVITESILGKKAWGVSLGVGSFLTFEFGRPIPSGKKIHGEFHVWIYNCAWRIQQLDKIIACSEDERDTISNSIKCLENLSLSKIDLFQYGFDTIFRFENNILLYLFTCYTNDYESWILYTPQEVITIGPAGNLVIENK